MLKVGYYSDLSHAIVRMTFLWRPTSFHESQTTQHTSERPSATTTTTTTTSATATTTTATATTTTTTTTITIIMIILLIIMISIILVDRLCFSRTPEPPSHFFFSNPIRGVSDRKQYCKPHNGVKFEAQQFKPSRDHAKRFSFELKVLFENIISCT